MILSGLYFSITSFNDLAKSPTKLQQIHPCDNSAISILASPKNILSTLISPNSFSINTIFSFLISVSKSLLIKVVLPAPRNPDTISIFNIK